MGLSQWAQARLPYLSKALGALGVKPAAVPVFAAQLDLETGGGTSYSVKTRNNVAGIGGRGNYKTYSTLDAGLDAYVSLLQRKYGTVLDAARTGDPGVTAKALGDSPWAAHHYRQGASGDEYSGGSGIVGTEGWALLNKLGTGQTIPPAAPLVWQAPSPAYALNTDDANAARAAITAGTAAKPWKRK